MFINSEGLIEISKTVQLKPYQPRPIKPVEIITDEELFKHTGSIAVVDTEKYNNYFLIAFKFLSINKYLPLEYPFNERQLSWIMHNYTTVGFNSLKYDLPMIWCSFNQPSLDVLQDLSDKIIFENLFPKQAEIDFKFKIFPTNHIDLFEVCPLRGSLKLYGARLHAKRIQELPYPINQQLDDFKKNVVKHYCYNDLDCTELDFINLKEQLELRTNLSAEYKTNVMSKSDAQIAESVIGYELKKLTGSWPKKPQINSSTFFHNFQVPKNLFFQTDYMKGILEKIKNVKFSVDESGRLEPSEMDGVKIQIGNSVYRIGRGGLHSSEKCRALKASETHVIKDIDVESYYPRIVINLGLYPNHLGTSFLNVYSTIVDRRVDAKHNERIAESENLKVTINGTFGKTGSPYSFLYAPEMTIQITVGGQLYLLMLIELLELAGIPAASANTDGIVVYCPKDKLETLTNIKIYWEQITNFKTEETEYEAIYSRDVNAYLAVKRGKDGNVSFKGKNDYYDPWRPQNAKDAYWRFQKNPTHQICVEAIEKLISDNIPIEITINECTDITKFICVKNVTGGAHKEGEYLGKTIRWYYAKNVSGTINYIKSSNKVPESEGAKPCMDLPDVFPNDIDYLWYRQKTIEMLEDCGYYQKQEQIRFF